MVRACKLYIGFGFGLVLFLQFFPHKAYLFINQPFYYRVYMRSIQQLLHLAEASEPQNYEFAPVEAESVVFEVMNYLERLASQQGVTFQAIVEPGLTLPRADRGALFTLLKNLLENAVQHSRAGSVVRLAGSATRITVKDEGAGVPAQDLPNLFKRFWRSADRRDLGAGLGLSICREIATAHGWELRAKRAEPGMIFELDVSAAVP